ncbi:MAG TPA: hypothetical protein VJU61_16745 [Polyangiaceae bacterium]|nr:hypothetical protein [Polyangiaceae bacterium]
MSHPRDARRPRWGVPAWITLGGAVLLNACDNDQVLLGPALEAEAPDGAEDVAVPPGAEQPRLPAGVLPPPSSCTNEVEFVRMGVLGEQYALEWVPARSQSDRIFYNLWLYPEDDDGSGDQGLPQSTAFQWSSGQEGSALGPSRPPPGSPQVAGVTLIGVSDDGNVSVARVDYEAAAPGGVRWAGGREPVWLDFEPRWQSSDGAVLLGCREGLVRWTESTGTQRVGDGCEFVGMFSSRTGDVVVSHVDDLGDRRRPFLWTESSGVSFLVPEDAPASRTYVSFMNERGDVLAGAARVSGQPQWRGFRWTPALGMQDLADLAGVPEDADVMPTGISADGRVIVGKVSESGQLRGRRSPGRGRVWPFRWTEETGMQDICADEGGASPSFLSASGDVVIGALGSGVFRWTEETGCADLGAEVLLSSVAFDGDLLLGVNEEGPFTLTFGKLAGTEPLSAAQVPTGPVPEGWSLRQLEGISADGRLAYGHSSSDAGEGEPWLLHVREPCAPGSGSATASPSGF